LGRDAPLRTARRGTGELQAPQAPPAHTRADAHASARKDSDTAARLQTNKGRFALHEAAYTDNEAMARALLDAGAELELQDERATPASMRGYTPLQAAALLGSLSTLRLLVSRGADINAHHMHDLRRKETALSLAAANGHLAAVRTLVALGADIQAGYSTPLHMAARFGKHVVVQELLNLGADPLAMRSDDGWLPCNSAQNSGHRGTAQVLAQAAEDAAMKRLLSAAAAARARGPLSSDAAELERHIRNLSHLQQLTHTSGSFTLSVRSFMPLDRLNAVAEEWGAGDTMHAVQRCFFPENAGLSIDLGGPRP
jgi:ankyrin repeat protein